MPRPIPILLLLLLTALLSRGETTGPSHYEQGVAAFEKKDWPAAREAFEAVIEKDQLISGDLLFNLGNTLFREEKPGLAALWYRRAVLLNPLDGAARQNLRLLRGRTGFHEFDTNLSQTIASVLKHSQWKWLAAGAGWATALALGALLFLRLRGGAQILAWCLAALGAPLAGVALWGAAASRTPEDVSRRAVVTQADVAVLSAPTETAGVIIDVPPGSEVIVHETRETWSYVEVPGDQPRFGWVRGQSLARLWPYSPSLLN